MHHPNFEHATPASCLRVLDAMGLEAWEEGENIFAIEPTRDGVQLASFEATGNGLRAFLEAYECVA
ncbi:MAG: hypothetical protein VX529_06455 [Pseudomonadota bacterium]|nr:hypothetical protein [Pseudomonadota bacterium]